MNQDKKLLRIRLYNMKVLIPHFSLSGASSYPDESKLFSNMEKVSLQGDYYWLCDYSGDKDLETGAHIYSDYAQEQLTKTGFRKITVAAFYTRLDDKLAVLLAMSDSLAASGDYALKANLMRIDKGEFVDLDDERLRPGLEATQQFTSDELDAIFVDGQPSEVPEMLK